MARWYPRTGEKRPGRLERLCFGKSAKESQLCDFNSERKPTKEEVTCSQHYPAARARNKLVIQAHWQKSPPRELDKKGEVSAEGHHDAQEKTRKEKKRPTWRAGS